MSQQPHETFPNPHHPKLIEQIQTNMVVQTHPNSVVPGLLNSIQRITRSVNLNINSVFRNNYYSSSPSNFKYILPSDIKNVTELRLASIEIPNSWYLFSQTKGNNQFQITTDNSGVVSTFLITIPSGNYDNTTLPDYLNNYFAMATTDLQYFQFAIDSTSFKSLFQLTAATPLHFSYSIQFANATNITDLMNTAGWILGFRMATYQPINGIITSEGIFDGGGDRYIYVAVDDYQYNSNALNIVCLNQSSLEKNILAKIPMVNGKLSMIIDDNSCPLSKTRKYHGPVNIRQLNIQLFDMYGSLVDLNSMDYSLTLELQVLYEGYNFKEINK